ncbi:gamma-glutamyl carboxylase [Lycorma delicatula]|uniref:gamma-glutamyl carboxylase n=1 Tax=Lycorma delicatula TaxID=130591 RepID=UPI003F50E007
MSLRKRKQINHQQQPQHHPEQQPEHHKLALKDIIINNKCWIEDSLGFKLDSLTSLENFTSLLYKECDGSSLAAVRMMFGIVMLIDIVEERGFSNAEKLWGDPNECRFPMFNFLQPLPVQWMCLLYTIMCVGAIGISLGLYFRQCCLAVLIPYWYIFLLNKTAWNNHSYLYGLLLILITISNANNCWSLDKLIRKIKTESTVPLWNYTLIRFQIFALYFFAGLKKIDGDWLHGYSMRTLSKHWVFNPFKLILSGDQVDLWIVHITGFLLDFTAGFLIFFDSTRFIAFFFLTMFHLMNSRLFHIGMFPYMCMVTMPIFCRMDWPKQLFSQVKYFLLIPLNIFYVPVQYKNNEEKRSCEKEPEEKSDMVSDEQKKSIGWKKKLTCVFVLFYVGLQCFLPYSHFVTKGYNNWTNGLYGYSWDMMVHTWDRNRVNVKIVDMSKNKEYFLNHEVWVTSERWTTHADMVIQFAHCIKDNMKKQKPSLNNISINIDVWCSLNGRFQQRMFDPKVNLLTAPWSPFKPVDWLMPLLSDLNHWRTKMSHLQEEVWSWSDYTDVLFYADFPGLYLENYIKKDLQNVSLTVLDGSVILETPGKSNKTIISGQSESVQSDIFHRVYTVSSTPSCYMYSFINKTVTQVPTFEKQNVVIQDSVKLSDILLNDVKNRWTNFQKVIYLMKKIIANNSLFFNCIKM